MPSDFRVLVLYLRNLQPEFVREGANCMTFWARRGAIVTRIGFDAWDHDAVEKAIETSGSKANLVTILCHGFRNRLMTGHGTPEALPAYPHRLVPVDRLAGVVAAECAPDVKIALYACSTAGTPGSGNDGELHGDGGFADMFRDAAVSHGLRNGWVDGHTVAGHTTKLHLVRRFPTDAAGVGGEWIIDPKSPVAGRWDAKLHGEFRFLYPTLTRQQCYAEAAR